MSASNATSSRTTAAQPEADRPRSEGLSSSTDAGTKVEKLHFGLEGRSPRLDARVHAYRRDIADIALAGRVISSHYARALPRACGSRATMVWPQPAAEGEAVSELLPGEGFHVLEYSEHWAWGYCAADHRVGYVESIELVEPAEATHVVCEAKVPVFADSNIEATRLACMPMGARLTGHEEGACLMSEMGCVPLSHLRRVDEAECDPAAVAMKLLHAPYVAGGRSHAGVDASGLIQLALTPCGVRAPRDLDMQREIGVPVIGPLTRGDIVIAGDKGGVMIDDLMLIHACRSTGKVTVEPVAVVEARHEGSVRRRVEA